MLRRSFIFSGLLLLAFIAAYGVERTYISGLIVDVQQGTRDRVQLYIVNTPIMTEEPYVTIAVEVNGTRYEGEFLPASRRELFPGFWKNDENVPVRVEKHFIYLKREDGSEAKFLLLNKPHSARKSQ
jgi:hypothetical protein